MKEIRVFGIDANNLTDDNIEIEYLSNEEFIKEAENQGLIWSLGNFADDFNEENVAYDVFIRFIIVETSEEDSRKQFVNWNQSMADYIYK